LNELEARFKDGKRWGSKRVSVPIRARATGIAHLEQLLYLHATGQLPEEYKNFDASSAKYLLSKKLPEVYGDKQHIELETKTTEPIGVMPRIPTKYLDEDDSQPPTYYNANVQPIIPIKRNGKYFDPSKETLNEFYD